MRLEGGQKDFSSFFCRFELGFVIAFCLFYSPMLVLMWFMCFAIRYKWSNYIPCIAKLLPFIFSTYIICMNCRHLIFVMRDVRQCITIPQTRIQVMQFLAHNGFTMHVKLHANFFYFTCSCLNLNRWLLLCVTKMQIKIEVAQINDACEIFFYFIPFRLIQTVNTFEKKYKIIKQLVQVVDEK